MEIEKVIRLSLREKMHELIETYGQEAIRETAELALKLHPDWLRVRKEEYGRRIAQRPFGSD